MKELYKILENAVLNGFNSFDLKKQSKITSDCLSAMEALQEKLKPTIVKINEPILIGHLNIEMGYNNYKKIEIGTPIYLFGGQYIITVEPINGSKSETFKYSIESLKQYINTLEHDEIF